jgi:hypothetical protein
MILYKKENYKIKFRRKEFINANSYDGIDKNPMLLILLITGRVQNSGLKSN